MTKIFEHRTIVAKILWFFAILALGMLLVSCKTVKQHSTRETSTKIERIIDTVTVDRIVEVPIKVGDNASTSAKSDETLDVSKAAKLINDLQKLLKDERYRNSKLAKKLLDLSENKLSMDTVYAKTKYSNAYSYVKNSQLFLHLENVPYDTIVNIIAKDRHIKDSINVQTNVTDTTTITVEKKSWFKKLEFYIGLVGLILFVFGAYSIFRR